MVAPCRRTTTTVQVIDDFRPWIGIIKNTGDNNSASIHLLTGLEQKKERSRSSQKDKQKHNKLLCSVSIVPTDYGNVKPWEFNIKKTWIYWWWYSSFTKKKLYVARTWAACSTFTIRILIYVNSFNVFLLFW